MIGAVVFDLDGVIVDSEQVWDEVREALVRERGGRWSDTAQTDMMGRSSPEWSRSTAPSRASSGSPPPGSGWASRPRRTDP
ncbi:MAG: hypothetical protein MSC30_09040 [Gaiellaceae bacterium MAG52_C11]|nr:hypothetical protein [Candidatus Gaiellasilicea maunaloa]